MDINLPNAAHTRLMFFLLVSVEAGVFVAVGPNPRNGIQARQLCLPTPLGLSEDFGQGKRLEAFMTEAHIRLLPEDEGQLAHIVAAVGVVIVPLQVHLAKLSHRLEDFGMRD
jgi:hypothetical protein